MNTTPRKLIPAQAEFNRAAHDQDLIEVPRRSLLDRQAEGKWQPKVIPVKDNQ
jgi:hypothetical protein